MKTTERSTFDIALCRDDDRDDDAADIPVEAVQFEGLGDAVDRNDTNARSRSRKAPISPLPAAESAVIRSSSPASNGLRSRRGSLGRSMVTPRSRADHSSKAQNL